MPLTVTDTGTLDAWVQAMMAGGRVVTRIPPTVQIPDPGTFGVTDVPSGQLGSRLALPDPSLGSGPLQWDYQPAPLAVRALDNAADISNELTTAVMAYSSDLTSFLTDVAQVPGNVAQGIVSDVLAPAVGAFLPSWAWWALGGVALAGVWLLLSDRGTDYAARVGGRASKIARAVV